jgi:hypothetical protein
MRFKFIPSVFIIISLISIIGCKKDQITNPIPSIKGGVHGSIWLVTENGYYPNDRSGVTVTVEGTLNSCLTDSNGIYALPGVEVGKRTLVFTKNGYGKMKLEVEIQKNYNVGCDYINIFELPSFIIQNLTLQFDTLSYDLSLTGYSSKTFTNMQGFVIFASSDSTVSSDTSKYFYAFSNIIAANSNTSSYHYSVVNFLHYGIQKGQKVYFTAYGTSHYIPQYWDSRINKTVYTSLSYLKSNVVSFTLPLSDGYGIH